LCVILVFHNVFSYINYSTIAAKLLRRALKPEFRTEAARREDTNIRFTPWKDGKPQSKLIQSVFMSLLLSLDKTKPIVTIKNINLCLETPVSLPQL
jgi:F-type H+-transporting ATPase subunit epsilon